MCAYVTTVHATVVKRQQYKDLHTLTDLRNQGWGNHPGHSLMTTMHVCPALRINMLFDIIMQCVL